MANWKPEDVESAFRRVWHADRKAGVVRTRSQYERMFPGYESIIVAAYEELHSSGAGSAADGPRSRDGTCAPSDQFSGEPSGGSSGAAAVGAGGAEPPVPPGDLAAALPADTPAAPEPSIGPYRILRELGRGAQATVYLAEDTRLPRRVALKVFNPGVAASAQMLARFRREAESASRLDHPGVCTVFEAGVAGTIPWIAMRHVDGRTLADWIAAAREKVGSAGRASGADLPRWRGSHTPQTVRRVAEFVERTCRALHCAHEAGLVHRDVNPGNIMVTPETTPVVLDFGLASWDDDGARLTAAGVLLGTPAYMAPEQISADRGAIDRRTDVYAIGVTLYEALTLRLPFSAPTREGLFSLVLSGVVDPPHRVNPRVPADLALVVTTAMERDPDRRYQTALDLAEDLRRVLDHRPIRARPTPAHVRVRQWTQRHPALATAAAASFVMLAAGLALSTYHLRESREREQRLREALAARTAALRHARALGLVAASSDAAASDPACAVLLAREAVRVEPLPATVQALHHALAAHREVACWDVRARSSPAACFSPDGSRVLLVAPDKTCRIADLEGTETARLAGHTDVVTCAAWSGDGGRIATGSHDGTVRLWDAQGRAAGVLAAEDERFERVLFVPGTTGLVTASVRYLAGDPEPAWTLRAWGEDGRELRRLGLGRSAVRALLVAPADGTPGNGASPDGSEKRPTVVVIGDDAGNVRLWDLATGAVVRIRTGRAPVSGIVLREGGASLVVVTADGAAHVFASDGADRGPVAGVTDVRSAASAGTDEPLAVSSGLDVAILDRDLGVAATAHGHRLPVTAVAVAPGGARIASGSADRTVRMWDLDGREILTMRGHADRVDSVAFGADGAHVLSTSDGDTARLWKTVPGEVAALRRATYAAEFGPDGERVVAACQDGTARITDLRTGRETVLRGHGGPVRRAAFAPGSADLVLTASEDGTARVWSVSGDAPAVRAVLVGHDGPVWHAAWSPDGRRVVTCGRDMTVRVWDVDGTPGPVLRGHTYDVLCAVFFPDGRRVLTSGVDTSVRVWDLGGREVAQFGGHAGPVTSVAFSASGDRIVTASADQTARVWDTEGHEIAVLRGHEGSVKSARFSADGSRILTASDDRTVRVWDLSGVEVLRLRGHTGWVWSAAYSPDGRRILSAAQDGTGLVWAASVEELTAIADRRVARGFTPEERRRYGELLVDSDTDRTGAASPAPLAAPAAEDALPKR